MIQWHHQLNGHEFEQALGVGDGQGSLVCCSPRGRKESDTTERVNWTEYGIVCVTSYQIMLISRRIFATISLFSFLFFSETKGSALQRMEQPAALNFQVPGVWIISEATDLHNHEAVMWEIVFVVSLLKSSLAVSSVSLSPTPHTAFWGRHCSGGSQRNHVLTKGLGNGPEQPLLTSGVWEHAPGLSLELFICICIHN